MSSESSKPKMKPVLDGVRIIDFTWVAAGPVCSRYLADQGAEVIKIESNTRPDTLRSAGPYKDEEPGLNRSGYFANLNPNKLSISLNLNRPQAVEIAKRLVSVGDVVVENFTPRAMKKWGLTYEGLVKVKPDLIMATLSNQGQWGPHSHYMGFGFNLQALVGINHLLGWPDREPINPGIAYTDYLAPGFGALAIVGALCHRRHTGEGQFIDLSQFEASIHCLSEAVLDFSLNQRDQMRQGNKIPNAAPHGAYRCQGDDRWCTIAVFSDQDWVAFCKVLDNPPWTTDPRFATLVARLENEDDLNRLVEDWTVDHQAEEVMTVMQKAGVAAGVVQNTRDLMVDPQLNHRHHYWRLSHPEMGLCAYDAPSFRLSRAPFEMRKAAPLLGEDSEYVYKELLGMSETEYVELLTEGVLE